ncbi:hypothetical protein HK098_002504 [Nowakowskiella sp. JEL0407]|nr:hypothetical protein HK098_002504 [Nowakowskiella sp. JEL0407]
MLFKDPPAEPINLSEAPVAQTLANRPSPAVQINGRLVLNQREESISELVNLKDRDVELFGAIEAKERKILEEMSDTYQTGLKNFPESCFLHMAVGQFYLFQLGNRPQCLALYSRAMGMHSKIDEKIQIYQRQKTLDEIYVGGDVFDFIAYESNLKLAKKSEAKATRAIIKFWGELLRAHPDVSRLQKFGASFSFAVANAKENYMNMIRLSPESVTGYRLYGNFLTEIMNDTKNGKILLQHADDLDEENVAGDDPDFMTDPFSLAMLHNSGTVTIAGDPTNLGKIIDINQQTCKMLGWKRTELIGQNVIKIIPRPFSDAHDDYLRKYLETGFGKIIDRQRTVLALLKSGYIAPAYLCVKQLSEPGGSINFIAALRLTNIQMRDGLTENYMIVHATDLRILHFTEDCTRLFGIKPQLQTNHYGNTLYDFGSETQSLFFHSIIPEYQENGHKFLSRNGGKTRITLGVNKTPIFDLYINAEQLEVLGHSFYIVRLRSKEASETEDDELSNEMDKLGCPFGRKTSSDYLEVSTETDEMPMNFSPSYSHVDLSKNSKNKSESLSKLITRKGGLRLVTSPKDGNLSFASVPHSTSHSKQSSHSSQLRSRSNSNTSGTSGGTSFLRSLISAKKQKGNNRLRWLKISFAVTLIVISFLAIFEHVYLVSRYNAITSLLSKIDDFGNLAKSVMTIAHHARTIQLSASEGLRYESSYLDNTLEFAKQLNASLLDLDQSHDIIAQNTLENGTQMELITLDNSSTFQNLALLDAITIIGSEGQHFVDSYFNLTEQSHQFSQFELCFLIVLSSIFYADLARSSYSTALEISMNIELVRAAIAPAFFLIVFVCVIQQLFLRIQRNQSKLFNLFKGIPKETIQGIYESHHQRLLATEDEDYADNDDDQEMNLIALTKLDSFEIDSDQKSKKNFNSTSVFSYIRNSWKIYDDNNLHIKSLLILIFCCVYFFSASALTNLFKVKNTHIAEALFQSNLEHLYLRQATFALREKIIQEQKIFPSQNYSKILINPNSTLRLKFLNASNILDSLIVSENAIFYGNNSMNIPEGQIIDLFHTTAVNALGNICSVNSEEFEIDLKNYLNTIIFDSDECLDFASGIMERGLHSVILWFYEQSNVVILEIEENVSALDRIAIIQILEDLFYIDLLYTVKVFQQNPQLYESKVQIDVEWFNSFHMATTISFIVTLFLFFVIVLKSVFKVISEENTRATTMLYMIPPEIFTNAKSLRAWAKGGKIETTSVSSPGSDEEQLDQITSVDKVKFAIENKSI